MLQDFITLIHNLYVGKVIMIGYGIESVRISILD